MKNGHAQQSGKNNTPQIEKAMATVPTGRGSWQGLESPSGCKRGQARQGAFCPAELTADSFLRHQFMPLYLESPSLPKDDGISEGALASLCLLADYLQIKPLDVSGKPYPYNILLAHWHTQRQLRQMAQNPELSIVSDDNGKVSMATTQTASRSYSLYYIPVLPLYRLLKSREDRTGAQLLISVFSYLYHVARIPYYRDADSYLFYHYEILEEWLTEEDGGLDDNYIEFNRRALENASHGGDVMERIIYNPIHLELFEQRVTSALPANPFEASCLKVAETALKLWRDFSESNIYGHLNHPDEDDDEENWTGYDNTIRIDEYVHFIADTESTIYDSLQQNIDAELNEKMYWQEHKLLSVYDENF